MKNWMDLYHQEDITCSQIGEWHRIVVIGENRAREIHFLIAHKLIFSCKLTFCINFMLQTGT